MATSIIKLHTLSGAGDGGPPCFILQVDDFHCLLDCGWHDKMSSEYCPTISKWARHIDAVLLSHQSLRHLGLLPYLVGTCGLKCPIYATTPVYKMGQLTLYDFYQSVYSSEDFSLFTLDDIDAAFDMVIQVKYQQKVNLPGRGQGLCITALPSGHTLGGTIWKLVKEDTDIVYAVDFNHKKDRHLNGATFDACMRPHLLILDSSNILYTHVRRKDRDENLRQSILRTLRRGGNVLLVVDTAGRCLEVAHFLEQCWLNQDSGMMAYGLAMLSNVAFNVVDFAKSLVEWMSEKVVRTFEDQRSNPFHFRHMQLCHTLEQLDDVPEPKVVLASSFDMNYGFAKQLFAEWADNDLNTVILTTRESHVSSKDPTTGQLTIMNRLIGLAQGDPTARDGLPTSSTGTLVLPMSLSQRVLASQLESMENQMPRVRNAVQQPGSETSPDEVSMNELHTEIPLADGSSAINGDDTPMDEQSTPTPDVDVPDTSLSVSPTKLIPTPSAQTITAPRPSITLTAGAHGEVQTPLNKLYQRSTSVVSKKLEHTMLDSQPSLVPSTQLTVGRHQPGYDIYPGLHNHAGGQFFRMAKRTQLLFPQVEKRIHWDDYGGFLDHDLFATDDKPGNLTLALTDKIKAEKPITPVTAEPKSVALVSSSILDCLAPKAGLTDDPENKTHVVTHQLEIPLRCELIFLDFEGRSDGEAMKRIILGLRPLEVIIVGNSGEAVDHLAQYCRTAMHLRSDLVHVPHGCEVVNCTKEEDIYQARMKDSLVSSLKFTKIHNYELAWVEATLTMESDNMEDVEMREDEQEKEEEEEEEAVEGGRKPQLPISADRFPVLSLPTGPVEAHKTVFVNKPRLSDLKQLLLAQGMVAEFMSGVLVVENCVAIKGSEAGKLVLEGLLSRTYFDVRKILYQQFAILLCVSVSVFISRIGYQKMKCTLEKIIEDVQLLVSRIESRESATDHLLQQIVQVQSDLLSMRQYQEEVRSFSELSERLSNHPKGPLIRCLAAENKQLEQLQIENRALCTSLDEHQSALDLIMKKYRSQVTKLMQANHLENTLKSSTLSSGGTAPSTTDTHSPTESTNQINGAPSISSNTSDTTLLTERMSALAAIAQDVCDRGDAYAAELEAELHRLRSENAGLREMLMISNEYSSDQAEDIANLDPIPGASFSGYKPRHMRYLLQNQSDFSNDSNAHMSGRSGGGYVTRPFEAFTSSLSFEPSYRVGRDDAPLNRSSELEDKDDIISQCETDDDLDKTYDAHSSDSTVIADSDQEHQDSYYSP